MLDNAPKAYLLESHCIFCIDKSELIVANKPNVHLDNLESTLLHFLICNQNRLVRYEEFEPFWNNRFVGDGVLTRVISAIRNKLKETNCDNIKIINKTKNGYILTGPIIPYVKSEGKNHRKFVPAIAIFSIIVLSGLIHFSQPTKLDVIQKSDKSYQHHDKIVNTSEMKHKFAFNDSKKLIAYVAHSEQTKRNQIHIFDRLTERTLTIEEQSSAYSPVWLSDNQLIYRAVSNDKCHIKQVELSSTFSIGKAINLFRCNEKSIANSLTRYQQNKLLSTNAVSNSDSNTLSLADLGGLPCKTINFPQLEGLTIYEVVGHRDSNEVIILATKDWQSTRIIKTSMEDEWLATWHYSPNNFVHTVSWDGKEVLLKDDNASILGFKFPGTHIDETRYLGIEPPFHSPSSVADGIAIISNSGRRQTLAQYDAETKNKEKLFEIPENMEFVGRNSKWGLVFIDRRLPNHSTLSYWVQSKRRFEPIIHLADEPNTANLAFSNDNSSFAFGSGDNIILTKFADQNKPTHIQRFIGSAPQFIDDSLYFLNKTKGVRQVSKLNSSLNSDTTAITPAHLFGYYDNQIVLSYKTKLGIWTIKPPFQSLLINTEFPVTKLIANDDSIYYQLTDGSDFIYQDGFSTLITLDNNEHLIDVNPHYFYSVTTNVRDSSIALLK